VKVSFGIWSYQFWTIATSVGGSVIFETCHRYPSSVDIDGAWKAARAFSTCEFALSLLFDNMLLLQSTQSIYVIYFKMIKWL